MGCLIPSSLLCPQSFPGFSWGAFDFMKNLENLNVDGVGWLMAAYI